MSVHGHAHPVEVTRSPTGRLTVVLDREFEPDEVLAALTEAARNPEDPPAPQDPLAAPAVPAQRSRQSERHYPGEFLG